MTDDKTESQKTETVTTGKDEAKTASDNKVAEIGGPKGPEPTRFGDWEQKGRCTDF
jgi:hypothetical protein